MRGNHIAKTLVTRRKFVIRKKEREQGWSNANLFAVVRFQV